MIASTEEAACPGIPNGKDEVADQPVDTVLVPDLIGTKKEFCVRGIVKTFLAMRLQRCNQFAATIHASVGDNPGVSVKAEGLLFLSAIRCGSEKRMPESDLAAEPGSLSVRTAKQQSIRQSFEDSTVDWSVVQVKYADDSAHSVPDAV
jgi:hypothetical protein